MHFKDYQDAVVNETRVHPDEVFNVTRLAQLISSSTIDIATEGIVHSSDLEGADKEKIVRSLSSILSYSSQVAAILNVNLEHVALESVEGAMSE